MFIEVEIREKEEIGGKYCKIVIYKNSVFFTYFFLIFEEKKI